MFKKKLIIVLVLILTVFLRFFRLAKSPPSLNWDEVAIGWNSHTIFHTRRDEFGTRLPLTFKSFGDYKAPALVYLTAPFVGLLGLNEWAVRLPSALFGCLTVVLTYFLTKELFIGSRLGKSGADWLGIIAGLLLAVSPWHLQFSRPAFEPNLALFFIVFGGWLFLKAREKPVFLVLSALAFAGSLYSYHSPKLFLPGFLLALFLIYRQELWQHKYWLLVSLVLGTVLVFPLLKLHFQGPGGARLAGTAVFFNQQGELKPLSLKLVINIIKNYLSHFSPRFLFWGSSKNPRIKLRRIGLLYWPDLFLLVIGLATLINQRKKQWARFCLAWLLIGPLPAAIGRDAPHSIRVFNMLPALIIAVALGAWQFKQWLKTACQSLASWYLLLAFYLVNFLAYFYRYHFSYPVYAAEDWQYGYQEMARYVRSKEDEVNKIIITSQYGQPHTFVYFFQKREPMEIFWGQMGEYVFRDINWQEDKLKKDVLLVGTPEQIPLEAVAKWERDWIVKEILFPDGRVAFRIVQK